MEMWQWVVASNSPGVPIAVFNVQFDTTLNPSSLKYLVQVFLFFHWYSISTLYFQDAVSLARTEEEPEAAARKLTEAAFSRGSADNITCIVVRFHHDKKDIAKPDKAESASVQRE